MGVVLPDDIRDLNGVDDSTKIETIYQYIKYISEQLEFWATNRKKEMERLEARIATLEQLINN